MSALRVAPAARSLAISFGSGAQCFATVESDSARHTATLEFEAARLRDEPAHLRGAPVPHSPRPACWPASEAGPPLSYLLGQSAWLSFAAVAVVPSFGADRCAPCLPCR